MEWLQKGGVLLYPLLFCSMVSLAIFLEKLYLLFCYQTKHTLLKSVLKQVREGQLNAALEVIEKETGPVGKIVRSALEARHESRATIEKIISTVGSLELKRLQSRVPWLDLIGRVAPMTGLFGTVIGMAQAFQRIAGSQGQVNPSILADGIWQALISTIIGLAVGIPALIFHHILEERMYGFAFWMKHYGEQVVDELKPPEATEPLLLSGEFKCHD